MSSVRSVFMLVALMVLVEIAGAHGSMGLRLCQTSGSQASSLQGSQITYKTFEGDILSLKVWKGNHVAVLTRRQDVRSAVMRKIVAAFDRAYEYYANATGRTPRGGAQLDGLTTIAEVENVHGNNWFGHGYVGSNGIELVPAGFDALYDGVDGRNEYDQLVFYEFGRNFLFYGKKIAYKGSEDTPAVTAGFAVLMRFLSMHAAKVAGAPFHGQPFDEFKATVESLIDTYEASPELSWENTFRINKAPQNSMDLSGTDLFASMCLHLARKYGGDQFIAKLWRAVDQQPDAKTTHDALVNFVRAASTASGKDLTLLFRNRWKWPI